MVHCQLDFLAERLEIRSKCYMKAGWLDGLTDDLRECCGDFLQLSMGWEV